MKQLKSAQENHRFETFPVLKSRVLFQRLSLVVLLSIVCSIRVAAAQPSIAITGPDNGASTGDGYEITGTASADTAVNAAQLAIRSIETNQYWNGTSFQNSFLRVQTQLVGPADQKTWTYTSTPELPGAYAIVAWVWDSEYVSQESSPRWFRVVADSDTQAPLLAINDLTAGENYTSPFALTGTAQDDTGVGAVDLAIRHVDLGEYWNGNSFQSGYARVLAELSGSSTNLNWTYSNFPDVSGVYAVSARALDTSGKASVTQTSWFNYSSVAADSTPPVLSIAEPSPEGVSVSGPFQLTGTVTDNVQVDRVEVALRHQDSATYWNGNSLVSAYTRVPATLSGEPDSMEWQINNLPDELGQYSVAVWSWDSSQNVASPLLNWFSLDSTDIDNEQPSIQIVSPLSATTASNPAVVTGTAIDNVQIDRVELAIRSNDTNFFWNGSSFQSSYTRVPADMQNSGAEVDWSYLAFPTTSGSYSVAAWAWDTSENLPANSNIWFITTESEPSPPGVDISNYDLVFSDEFNTMSLNPNNWNTSFYWGPYKNINAEEQFYIDTLGMHADSNFTPFEFTGESLIINAVKTTPNLTPPDQPPENDPIWDQDPDKSYTSDFNPDDIDYLSGIITSATDFNFTHGYVEARVRLPIGTGLWPAFWLLNTKYVEDSPEIDIMEYLGQDSDRVYHTYHYFDVDNSWTKISSPTYETEVDNLSTEFHTFGLAWEADQLIWFVDGVETQRITDADYSISRQSMYVIANMAVGGAWPGSPDALTVFPAQYELDYIRVYQKKPVTPITPAVLQSEFQLMFSDEFNSNSVDESKWDTSFLWGPYFPINNEEQIYIDKFGHHTNYSRNPFTVDNGVLKIRAQSIDSGVLPNQPAIDSPQWQQYPSQQYYADYLQPDGWTPGYTSGILTSYDAFKFVHGYVEMRAKLPQGSGLWPAFWLLNGYYVGPQPEIDVMEFKGEEPGTVHHSYHFSQNDGSLNSSAETYSLPNGELFSDDFHTFGIEWTAGTLKWYVDGNVTRTLNSDDVSLQLMYIIVNLAVGGNFVGPVDTSAIPADFEIDYIRAYQRKSTP